MATIDSVKLPDNSTYDLTDNHSGYQKATLTTPLTINGTQETTVEGALGGLNDYGNALKGAISNENLLDNPFFTVNQRGQTNYTGNVYTLDRWKLDYAGSTSNIDVTSSGVKINNLNSYTLLEQKLENITPLINRQLTASVLLSDGTILSGTGVYDGVNTINLLPTTGVLRLQINSVYSSFRIVSYSTTALTIRAVKLEVGTVSTLHLDVAPDYTTELLKCQRYYFRNTSTGNYAHIAIGTAMTTTSVYIVLPIPVPMRTAPTFAYAGSLSFMTNGQDVSVTNVTAYPRTDHTCLLVLDLASSVTAGVSGSVNFSTSGSYYELKADL